MNNKQKIPIKNKSWQEIKPIAGIQTGIMHTGDTCVTRFHQNKKILKQLF